MNVSAVALADHVKDVFAGAADSVVLLCHRDSRRVGSPRCTRVLLLTQFFLQQPKAQCLAHQIPLQRAQTAHFALNHRAVVRFDREIRHEFARDARSVEHNLAAEAILGQVVPKSEQDDVVDNKNTRDIERKANTSGRCRAKVKAAEVVDVAPVDVLEAVADVPAAVVVVLDVVWHVEKQDGTDVQRRDAAKVEVFHHSALAAVRCKGQQMDGHLGDLDHANVEPQQPCAERQQLQRHAEVRAHHVVLVHFPDVLDGLVHVQDIAHDEKQHKDVAVVAEQIEPYRVAQVGVVLGKDHVDEFPGHCFNVLGDPLVPLDCLAASQVARKRDKDRNVLEDGPNRAVDAAAKHQAKVVRRVGHGEALGHHSSFGCIVILDRYVADAMAEGGQRRAPRAEALAVHTIPRDGKILGRRLVLDVDARGHLHVRLHPCRVEAQRDQVGHFSILRREVLGEVIRKRMGQGIPSYIRNTVVDDGQLDWHG
ncbi:hypothetical protein H310_10029 [Aphanomyces invadans]|uniref:Uncharacterized protein n=1 Tax=Aphanomyces invadans TaxID=157072 RepID=A0A024TTQ3_9STRA|nr:hypothetical protein H310_10029 [Aphanomyces invadans]ETV96712.1 hypothetical protein H310_10029 [Aphanomyces invadans]|eukprot:XP_008874489.1 hypothetical protein H310_10029 [Aphanomyces invadans]